MFVLVNVVFVSE